LNKKPLEGGRERESEREGEGDNKPGEIQERPKGNTTN